MAQQPDLAPPSRAAARAGARPRPARAGEPSPSPAPQPAAPLTDAALARRAQLLATEHWGLLAARSTAQSEVLTRITIFLTLVSAGLVTIGLLGQATRFSDRFPAAALAILGFLAVIGVVTHVRVLNASEEDMMYVVAMNRIRSAYVDLDPEVARYFLAAVNDDRAGMELTYSFLRRRSISHLFGSSMTLMAIVVSCVIGLLAGAVPAVLGATDPWPVLAGAVAGIAYFTAMLAYGGSNFSGVWRRYRPLRPTQHVDGDMRHADGETRHEGADPRNRL